MRADRLPEPFDFGMAIAQMVKCCERAFADMFEQRRGAIQNDAIAQQVLTEAKKWEFASLIPMALDKAGICRMLNLLKKDRPHWSGLRNCVSALLLFGGQVTVSKEDWSGTLNPLDIDFNDELACSTPLLLLQLHERRNGFAHHDLGSKEDVLNTWDSFVNCMRGLLHLFYGSADEAQ
jgi:hypothetical protein